LLPYQISRVYVVEFINLVYI